MVTDKKIILAGAFLTFLGSIAVSFYILNRDIPYSDIKEQPMKYEDLTQEQFSLVKEEFIRILNETNPQLALSGLREKIKTDNALLRSCHALVHEIGHAAYEKYGGFGEAIKYQDEICNSGYIHGIIESHFSKTGDVFGEMQTLCAAYKEGKYLSWQCHHGIGHGLMYYTANDLPKSLGFCANFKNSFSESSCVNGVFMENFNTDQKFHVSKFLNKDDPFYPCQTQISKHKGHCYIYAPMYYLALNKNDYAGALNWCDSTEMFYKNACAQGVGSQLIKENINNIELLKKVCMGGKPSQTEPCIIGATGFFINHHGSLEPAKKLCEALNPENAKHCIKSVEFNSSLFD